MTNHKKDAKKIVLMGLDKAGKTSILLCLKGKTEISAFTQIPPTFGLSRDFIEDGSKEYAIFDFGGQEAYIEGYMSNLDVHLAETDKVIF
nr:ADP-ribosylation factor-like protein [Candidatus Sigynarchaeota archaeon]